MPEQWGRKVLNLTIRNYSHNVHTLFSVLKMHQMKCDLYTSNTVNTVDVFNTRCKINYILNKEDIPRLESLS
jgi:hypothetical protein